MENGERRLHLTEGAGRGRGLGHKVLVGKVSMTKEDAGAEDIMEPIRKGRGRGMREKWEKKMEIWMGGGKRPMGLPLKTEMRAKERVKITRGQTIGREIGRERRGGVTGIRRPYGLEHLRVRCPGY